jgi:hypothetical protein
VDAKAFISNFYAAFQSNPAHIYISALPFAPPDSLISVRYRGSYPRTLRIKERVGQAIGSISTATIAPAGGVIVVIIGDSTLKVFDMTRDAIEVFSTTLKSIDIPVDDRGQSLRFVSGYAIVVSDDGKLIAIGRDECRVFNIITGSESGFPTECV